MLVFWNENLVYLAVPKTGSTALEAALDPLASISFRSPPNVKHSHAYRFHHYTRPLLDRTARKKWELVAVIREPISWLGSWYRYLQRGDMQATGRSTAGISFETFIEHHLARDVPKYADVGRQSFMVESDDGKLLVDHLFAYEHQTQLRGFFEKRLGERLNVGSANVSPNVPLELSAGLEARLRKEKAREFRLHEKALARTEA